MVEFTQKDFDSLKRVHDSVNEKVLILQSENENLVRINKVLQAEKVQWDGQKALQEQIIAHQLGSGDDTVRKLQDEIIELKGKIKELKNN